METIPEENEIEDEELFIDQPIQDDFRKNMLTFAGFVLFMNIFFNILSDVEKSQNLISN